MLQEPLKILREYVQRVGLKTTRQRELIALEFFNMSEHMTAEEVLEHVRKADPHVSLATVYRTLKLLQDCGLARSHNFGDGQARFEPATGAQEHHDHLICTKCGRIIEFYNEKIEQLQDDVAKAHGFEVQHHRMELYGLCPNCKNG
jgi:Fur family ferric uptake transcriptional regulator